MPGILCSPSNLSGPARDLAGLLAEIWADAPDGRVLGLCFDLRTLEALLAQRPGPSSLLLPFWEIAVFAELGGRGPCPHCLRHWLSVSQSNRPNIEETSDENAISALTPFLRSRLQSQVQNTITVEALEFATGTVSRHFVFPRRDCACARFTAELPLQAHCSAVTGIVRSLQVSSAPAAGAYRALAVWNSPPAMPGARPRLHRQASYGRGQTAQRAVDGAIGEALERYSLVYRGDEPMTRAKAAELETLVPNEIQLYSDRQYAERSRWQTLPDETAHIPEEFDPSQEVDWLAARDLFGGPDRFVPAALCLMWYQFRPGAARFASADTIGCGSGRSFDDALLHALLEWVERDAMALWWYNRARRPAVRLASFEDPAELLAAEEALRVIGRRLYLLDCTTDLGLPAYVSVAPRMDGTELLFAGAAHPSPRVAAWKAVSEVAQVWTTAQSTGRLPETLRPWLQRETLATQAYLAPNGAVDAPPEPPPLDGGAQRELVLARLRRSGLRAYAVDHSRPDVLLRTARAIVPGLRHIWNRRAPGRLYDVPPRLGWLPAPLTEEQLNPICCMI